MKVDSQYQEFKSDGQIENKNTPFYYKHVAIIGHLDNFNPDEDVSPIKNEIISEIDGVNGGSITKLGLRIPCGCSSFSEFSSKMKEEEAVFYSKL